MHACTGSYAATAPPQEQEATPWQGTRPCPQSVVVVPAAVVTGGWVRVYLPGSPQDGASPRPPWLCYSTVTYRFPPGPEGKTTGALGRVGVPREGQLLRPCRPLAQIGRDLPWVRPPSPVPSHIRQAWSAHPYLAPLTARHAKAPTRGVCAVGGPGRIESLVCLSWYQSVCLSVCRSAVSSACLADLCPARLSRLPEHGQHHFTTGHQHAWMHGLMGCGLPRRGGWSGCVVWPTVQLLRALPDSVPLRPLLFSNSYCYRSIPAIRWIIPCGYTCLVSRPSRGRPALPAS